MNPVRSVRLTAVGLTVACLAAVSPTVVHASGDGPVAAAPSVTVRDAVAPTLTTAGPNGMLLTVDRPIPHSSSSTLYAVSGWHAGSTAPTWGRRVALGRSSSFSEPVIAFNSAGAGVAAWGTDRNGGGTVVRTRTPNGRWSPAYRIPHADLGYADLVAVAVNAHGVVAVVAPGRDGSARLAVHRPGHTWRTRRVPGAAAGATSVAVASDGWIYVAGAYAERGGDGTAFTGSLSPSGTWATSYTKGLRRNVQDASIYLTGNGTQYLVAGRIGSWQSTEDTELYWPTRYTIFTRSSHSGAWTQVWDRDGAAAIEVRPLQSRLRLTWVQYADPLPSDGTGSNPTTDPSPQKLELRTVLFPGNGSVERVLTVEDTTTPYASDLAFTTAQSGIGTYAAGWRTHASTRRISPLTVWSAGSTRTYADASRPVLYDTQAAVACVADRCWVARTIRQQLSGGRLVGGTVEVDPAG